VKYLWMAIACLFASFFCGASMFLSAHEGSPEVVRGLFLLGEFIFWVVCGYILTWLLFKIFD